MPNRIKGRWAKGQSGNPSGRSKTAQWVREFLAQDVEPTLDRVRQLTTHPDPRIALEAIKLILERAIGKPQQGIEISGPDGGPVQLSAAIDRPPPSKSYEEWLARHKAKA